MVEQKPSKLMTRVRFPSPAPASRRYSRRFLALIVLFLVPVAAHAVTVGRASPNALAVVAARAPRASIVVAADAGKWEAKAAADLHDYVRRMSGADLPVLHEAPRSGAAIFVGRAALAAEPSLATRLAAVAKKNPLIQADAIVALRQGARLYLAGSNDESHYFAVAWLLQQWGCRWYLPTAFGEVVPDHADLGVGTLDYAYAPPFELRHYWLSWNGDTSGADEFRHRNFMSDARMVGMEQTLDRYTSDIAPAGGTHFQVPFAAPATAQHVAGKIEADYAAGKDISLAIADGMYGADADIPLISDYDRYMLAPSLTDAMLTLYNNVAELLRRKYPQSKAMIGGLAYTNATLPPRKVTQLAPNIVMWIAPIDIDPNHAMDDPRSPPKQEYRRMLEQWAKVTQGRLAIYDYDQAMLVWRDLPDPSQQVFARDVKEYRRLGLVGLGTESRGAMATVFLNLFFRGQLMWNPDADVGAMLAEFYPAFYGPAAEPMARYWNAIFQAWETTSVTEHEYMAAPAIYTPALVQALKRDLEAAEAVMQRQRGMGRDGGLYRQRLQFTRLSFEIIANYVAMTSAAARDADYPAAAKAGEAALAARMKLAQMNPTFTTHVVGEGAETVQSGAAWFPAEVDQMRALATLTDGSRGSLVAKLPPLWSFAVEQPVPNDWIYLGPEGAEAGRNQTPPAAGWQPVRTDLYLQGQGVSSGPAGHYWYKTSVDLDRSQAARPVHIRFSGLFNEVWLYVNGQLIAHREYREPWWRADYRFEWEVDLTGRLKPGPNVIALRGFNPHHFGGIFRRPFLYVPR
jgi:uncharacterized protein DUF4838